MAVVRRVTNYLYQALYQSLWPVARQVRPIRWLVSRTLLILYALPYRLAFLRRRVRALTTFPTVLCYPDRPLVQSTIFKICKLNGWSLTIDPKRPSDYALVWQNATFRSTDSALTNLVSGGTVINEHLSDISKHTVDRTFAHIFGYATAIDPTAYRGQCVSKSIFNARHDGEVITCPIPPDEVDPDRIYQRLLDNTLPDGMVRDMRLPIFNDTIPYVYLKDRPISSRFKNKNARAAIAEVADLYTPEEIENVLAFCRAIGMDFGEIDTIRDQTDGRLYIIDANSTPSGPPNHLSADETKRAARILARTFVETMPRYRTS